MVQRTPEAPRARELILSSITSRTTSSGSASPTPQQWDMIRFRCRVSVSPASIRVVASLPKPVFTPYTGGFAGGGPLDDSRRPVHVLPGSVVQGNRALAPVVRFQVRERQCARGPA